MPTCPSCAAELPGDASDCPRCGSNLAAARLPRKRRKHWSNRWWFLAPLFLAMGAGAVVIGPKFLHAIRWGHTPRFMSASQANLKQQVLAAHWYLERFGSLPSAAAHREPPAALHSWQTHLLPFLEEQPTYDAIDLDKAWDDHANAVAFQRKLRVFLNPAPEPGITHDERGYALSHYAGSVRMFDRDPPLRYDDIADGASNTLLIGEVKEGLRPWSDPENLRDPAIGLNAGPATFGAPWHDGVMFSMADGSVRMIPHGTPPELLKSLATPDGGEEPVKFTR